MWFKWKLLTAEVGMIASHEKYPSKNTRSYKGVVNAALGSKEKGEVRNLANRKGDTSKKTILEIQLPTF